MKDELGTVKNEIELYVSMNYRISIDKTETILILICKLNFD